MSSYLNQCPECSNTKIFGRMGEWWCGNTDCAVKWGNDDNKSTNQK